MNAEHDHATVTDQSEAIDLKGHLMRSVMTVSSLVLLLSAPVPVALAQTSSKVAKDGAALESEKAALLEHDG